MNYQDLDPRVLVCARYRLEGEAGLADGSGHVALSSGRCHPLTVLDDHSRYAVGLEACADQRGTTVQERLTTIFRRCGLPRKILVDNGSPWGSDQEHPARR